MTPAQHKMALMWPVTKVIKCPIKTGENGDSIFSREERMSRDVKARQKRALTKEINERKRQKALKEGERRARFKDFIKKEEVFVLAKIGNMYATLQVLPKNPWGLDPGFYEFDFREKRIFYTTYPYDEDEIVEINEQHDVVQTLNVLLKELRESKVRSSSLEDF